MNWKKKYSKKTQHLKYSQFLQDSSCFHGYSNSNDSLTDSFSETEETTCPELVTIYDPATINLSDEELNRRCTKAYEKFKNISKASLVIWVSMIVLNWENHHGNYIELAG